MQAIVGDGAFMMTCMEILTAATNNLGVVYYVFNDGELAQIGQAQAIPYDRKPCTQIGKLNIEGVALATGAAYLPMNDNAGIAGVIGKANAIAAGGRPVDRRRSDRLFQATAFTAGAVKTNFGRFPLNEKLRFLTRAAVRHVVG